MQQEYLRSKKSTIPPAKVSSQSLTISLFYSSTTLNFDRNYKIHHLLFFFGSLHWINSKWEWLISVRVKGIILCSMLHDTVFQTRLQHVHCSQWEQLLLKYAGMTNLCHSGEHWPYVTRSWCNFCFLVEHPPLICILFLKKKSFGCTLICFSKHNISLTSTQVNYLLSQIIPRSNTIFFNSHFAVIFVSCSPIPPHWARSSWFQIKGFLCATSRVPHPLVLSIIKFAMNTIFFLYSTRVSEDIFTKDCFLSSCSFNYQCSGECVYDILVRKSSWVSNYICSGLRGFSKIKRKFVPHLLHTRLKNRVTD